MLVEEDAVTSYLVNGTFVDDVCAILGRVIQKRWVGLKNLMMLFVDELPNLVDGPDGRLRLRDES